MGQSSTNFSNGSVKADPFNNWCARSSLRRAILLKHNKRGQRSKPTFRRWIKLKSFPLLLSIQRLRKKKTITICFLLLWPDRDCIHKKPHKNPPQKNYTEILTMGVWGFSPAWCRSKRRREKERRKLVQTKRSIREDEVNGGAYLSTPSSISSIHNSVYLQVKNSQCLLYIPPLLPLYTASPSLESFLSPFLCHPFHIPQIWPQGWETSLWNVRTLWMFFFFLFFLLFQDFNYRHLHIDFWRVEVPDSKVSLAPLLFSPLLLS